MSGFTKLVPEIVQSSIWNERAEVRCVWITMLATKDDTGFVRGNARSLARIANVSPESVNEALLLFESPDPDSNTPDHDGRRIVAVPGGWHVLNHALYRGRDYREVERARKRDYRSRMSGQVPDTSGQVPDTSGQVPDTSVSVSASVSASASEDRGCKGEVVDEPDGYHKDTAVPDSSNSAPKAFDAFWAAYPRKTGKEAARRAWAKAKAKPDVSTIIAKIAEWKQTEQWQKEGGQYIPYPATWLNQGRWDDDVKIDVVAPINSDRRNTFPTGYDGDRPYWLDESGQRINADGSAFEANDKSKAKREAE
jgi:hypothetical protein